MNKNFQLGTKDQAIVATLKAFLRKLLAWDKTTDRQVSGLARALDALVRLPTVTRGPGVVIRLKAPAANYDNGDSVGLSWVLSVSEDEIEADISGYLRMPDRGHDSFTVAEWSASTGEESSFYDYRFQHDIPGLPALNCDSVDALDLTADGYELEVDHDDESDGKTGNGQGGELRTEVLAVAEEDRLVWQCNSARDSLKGSECCDQDLARLTPQDWPNLRDLDLSYAKVTDKGLEYLRHFPKLQALYLTGLDITGDGLRHLLGLPVLEMLDLADNSLGDADLHVVGQFKSLRRLNLNHSGITGNSLKWIAGLTELDFLELAVNDIYDSDLAFLPEMRQLRGLDLSQTSVTNAGLAWLAQLECLEVLRAGHNHAITDAGLEHVNKLPLLATLDLCYTGITDHGLRHLWHMPALSNVNLQETLVSPEGVQQLQYTLPVGARIRFLPAKPVSPATAADSDVPF